MPLFEVETDAHIIITWAADENAANAVVREAYPTDKVIRMTKRPRDTWVISKGALGLTNKRVDVCTVARDCLSKAAGDKVHAIRLYMHETGTDLEHARKVIESNMAWGWKAPCAGRNLKPQVDAHRHFRSCSASRIYLS